MLNPGVVIIEPTFDTIAAPVNKTVIREPFVDELYVRVLKQRWTAKSAYQRYLNDMCTFETMCKMYPNRVSRT